MKPRYVIVNEVEKAKFEKEYELPYGYADSIVYLDFDEALKSFKQLSRYHKNLVIEKHDSGSVCVIYRQGDKHV